MDRALNRNTAFALGFVFLFAFWAFWQNYISILFEELDWRFHFHAIALVSWCVLMVLQAYLIRTNRRGLHKKTGRISFVLVPLVIVSTVLLSHFRENLLGFSDITIYGVGIVSTLLLQFTFVYGLAIYHRKSPLLHARFMICTALPMIPPILDRIVNTYILTPEGAQFLPQINGHPLYPLISYMFIDLVLIAFSLWDWKSRRRLNVFPMVLGAFVLLQSITFFGHRWAFWRDFAEWFLALPLS